MTYHVAGVLGAGRAIDKGSFSDITGSLVGSVEMVDGQVVVTFSDNLPADVAARVARRITMPAPIEAAFTALEQRVAALETQTK